MVPKLPLFFLYVQCAAALWSPSSIAAHFAFCFTSCVVFVCVAVLRPSQPNGVMSSMVSLPNHTFTGQA